jgi:hypothetical protein
MLVKMMVRGILTPCVSRGSMIALSLAPVLLSGCPSPNHAPELVPPPDTTVMVGQSLSVPIQADDPDDDAITISLLQGPDSATLVNRTLLWSPAAADVGTHAFVLAYTEPNAAFAEGVPDGAMYAQVSGSGEFSAPVSAMTLDLAHFDNSNICTVDVYWDHILLTPLAPASPTPSRVDARALFVCTA